MSAPEGVARPPDEDLPEFLLASPGVGCRGPVARRDTRLGDVPAEPGLWVFILGDLTHFAVMFLVFAVQRRAAHTAYVTSAQELLTSLGAANTVVLLTGSYVVVRALRSARGGDLPAAARLVALAQVSGAVFIAVKAFEYVHVIAGAHSPRTEPFFMYYFVLTGLHLLHVIVGTALLTAWRRRLRDDRWRPGFSEGVAVYWHMVDLLWVIIFALLYVEAAA